jgi:hypothetical protein
MATKYANIFHCKITPKITQIGICGLKIYDLATLILIPTRERVDWGAGLGGGAEDPVSRGTAETFLKHFESFKK